MQKPFDRQAGAVVSCWEQRGGTVTGLDKKTIGQRVAKLRTERGWSQEVLAERVHVSRQTVSNWERGKTLVDVQSLATMADELECPLSELLGEGQLRAAREGSEAAQRELRVIYVVLALLWVPAIALGLTERVSGVSMLWVWCALLVVCAPLTWRAWRLERDHDLHVTHEVARFVETGELPTGDERPKGHRVLAFMGIIVIFLIIDALLDVFF